MFGILFKEQTNFERRTSWESKGTTPPPPQCQRFQEIRDYGKPPSSTKSDILGEMPYAGPAVEPRFGAIKSSLEVGANFEMYLDTHPFPFFHHPPAVLVTLVVVLFGGGDL